MGTRYAIGIYYGYHPSHDLVEGAAEFSGFNPGAKLTNEYFGPMTEAKLYDSLEEANKDFFHLLDPLFVDEHEEPDGTKFYTSPFVGMENTLRSYAVKNDHRRHLLWETAVLRIVYVDNDLSEVRAGHFSWMQAPRSANVTMPDPRKVILR